MQSVVESFQRVLLLSRGCGKGYPQLQHQSLRFYRKPRWIGIAKSKMYKIIDLPPQPKMEEEEMKTLMEGLRLYKKSLWTFQRQIYEEQEARSQSHAKDISEEVELERIFLENERDNANVKAIREQQLGEEWRLLEESIRKERGVYEDKELQMLQVTEEKIQAEMERLKTVIKEENLDEAIEKALAVEVDYNFGIDKDGKVYKGRQNHDKGEAISISSLSGPLTFQADPSASTSSSTSTSTPS